jgi:hypothetical protein
MTLHFVINCVSVVSFCSVTLTSRLFLADLGGSEQVKKSKVEAGMTREGLSPEFSLGFQMATHMREAVNINLGLLALKKCIEALQNRSSYVPFQDSKLTMLLSDGLGGNCKTSVIVCAHTEAAQIAETVATLRFGERCALVETTAANNASLLENVLRDLEERIAHCEEEIRTKERWELREENRDDALAEEGTIEKALGGRETRVVVSVIGAEAERRLLASLLQQREQFAGSLSDEALVEIDQLAENLDGLSLHKKKPVLGFGKHFAEVYGLGGKFDEGVEAAAENERFQSQTHIDAIPTALRGKKVVKTGWATGETMEESAELLEKRAKRIKRNKLAYSGISA